MSETERTQGRMKEITSLANPIIKDIKLLEKKRYREETNSFLVEGMKLVIDAMDMGWHVKTLIHAKSALDQPSIEKLVARCAAARSDILAVPEKVLVSITRRDNPQMVVAVLERQFAQLADFKGGADDVYIALDRVRDPGNLGTIIRTGDAVGAKGVILVGDTTDMFAMETVRATMGSLFAMPVARAGVDEFEAFAKQWPGQVIGTHLAGAVDYRVPDYSKGPIILLMGNEQAGLPPQLVSVCTSLVKIPQVGRADSLNLAIATGVCLFEARRHALSLD